MPEIFTINLLTEPDFQRLNNFLIKALKIFSSNIFKASIRIPDITSEIRRDHLNNESILTASLLIKNNTLFVKWFNGEKKLSKLNSLPDQKEINSAKEYFNNLIQNTSPELLRIQNIEIKKSLDNAKEKANLEIKKIEDQLSLRKLELQEYIVKAETDSLTGLLNRRSFNQHLNQALRELRSRNRLFSLMYLDLDFFKAINDTYGHNFGDKVLKSMAMNMHNCIRQKTDLAFRIGGDEFSIILFSNSKTATRVAKKIINGIQQGISIGFTTADKKDTPEALSKRADMALYYSKEKGRSSIAVAKKSPKTEDPSASSLEILYNGSTKTTA